MADIHPLDELVLQTVLAPEAQKPKLIQGLVEEARRASVFPASIGPIYHALRRGEISPMTIPAFNVRGMTYDIARAIWRMAIRLQAAPIIFELAPSEAECCRQPFEEYAAVVMAAAAREGWQGPVFLQGDHIAVESLQALEDIKSLCERLVRLGYFQIDIDASHIPVPEGVPLEEFHQLNARSTAELTRKIRSIQPQELPVTMGAEVGEIGKRNTTPEDIEIFMRAYLSALGSETPIFDKLSVQTGTLHGGIVLKDGTTGEMPLDLDLAVQLSQIVRQDYSIAGLVQHGASTLSLENLACLPERGVIEVHLATGIQNIVFDHPAFPVDLRAEMVSRLVSSNVTPEGDTPLVEDDEFTAAQRFYHARWEAWGLFKQELSQLPEASREAIGEAVEDWVEALFYALRVAEKGDVLARYKSD
jgi:fructose/tagatose bisphosphate aldolase